MRLIRGEGDLSKSRFEAFSDGVFAIAITLLVLEIHVPELPHPSDAAMAHALRALGLPLLTYITSFMTVGIIWLNHHATFHHVEHIDRTTLVLNLVLLAVVCFLPYPTALLARYGPFPSTTVLYGATFTAMSIAYGTLWQYAARREASLNPEAPRMTTALLVRGALGTPVYALGTIVAAWAPKVSVLIFIALAIYYLIPGLFRLGKD